MRRQIGITKLDIRIYNILYDVVVNCPKKLGRHIPSFIVNETIFFFQTKEEYEKCHHLKVFFDNNKHRVKPFSRKEYLDYGWQTI